MKERRWRMSAVYIAFYFHALSTLAHLPSFASFGRVLFHLPVSLSITVSDPPLRERACDLGRPIRFFHDVESDNLRQVSGYPIPHGGQHQSCILRRWRPAFLHPKGETQICHRADEQNALKIVPFPQ
jgi:hypothetical protein